MYGFTSFINSECIRGYDAVNAYNINYEEALKQRNHSQLQIQCSILSAPEQIMAKNAGCALVALLVWIAVTEAKPSMNIVHQCEYLLDLRVNAALNILQMHQLRLESLPQAFHFRIPHVSLCICPSTIFNTYPTACAVTSISSPPHQQLVTLPCRGQ